MPFYGSRISENISRTPEGYLVCHNVPVARTGWQDYTGRQIDGDGAFGLDPNKIYKVYRSPEEVFSPATIASFEGKTVTDEHPPDLLTVDDDGQYSRGHMQNVKEGDVLDNGDRTLASDLVIKELNLITKVDGGVREVSCGYNCKYVANGDGTFRQIYIRGNHVAVVPNGRAGKEVSIRDSAVIPKEKTKVAVKDPKKNFIGRMLTAFAKDESVTPEEVADAAKLFDTEGETPEKKENKPEANPKDEDAEPATGVEAKLDKLIALLTPKPEPKGEDDDEDLIPEDGDGTADEDEHKPTESNDSARAMLLAMKPHVAKSNDTAAVKHWNESWKALKTGAKDSGKGNGKRNGYAALLNADKPNEVKSAMDGKGKDDSQAATAYEASIKAHHRSAKK